MKGILGRKIGMTSVFAKDGKLIPVTVIEVEPNVVTQIKTKENDGYEAIQLGFENIKEKNATKAIIGHAKKANTTPKRFFREIRGVDVANYNVGDEISVDSKLEKLVPNSNRKKFWEMFENEKLPWVTSYFSKNGYRIQQSAAKLVLELIENNTQSLAAECSRFFVLFPKDHEITEADVESVLTHNREENAFSLFRELANSNDLAPVRLEKGLQILQKIRLSKENSSVMIIAGLASCFRKLQDWHKRGEQAIPQQMLQKQYRSAAKVWTMGQTAAILAVLASTDMEIRSGGSQMEDVLLQKMIYEIVIKNGAQLSTLSQDC